MVSKEMSHFGDREVSKVKSGDGAAARAVEVSKAESDREAAKEVVVSRVKSHFGDQEVIKAKSGPEAAAGAVEVSRAGTSREATMQVAVSRPEKACQVVASKFGFGFEVEASGEAEQ